MTRDADAPKADDLIREAQDLRQKLENLAEHCDYDLDLMIEIREFLTRLADALEERQWQPIETAPKDKEIWVFAPKREGLSAMQSICKWHPDAGFCIDEIRFVTHWMPLPQPPSEESDG